MERTKILFLITKSNFGGAQRYVYDLATRLDPTQYDVAVALGGNGTLIDMLREHRIRTIQIPSLARDISLKKELLSFREIYSILRTENPTVLHVNSSKAGGMGALTGRLCGVKTIIYTAHGWAFNEKRSLPSRMVLAFLHWLTILLAHKTIAVSRTTQLQMHWPFTRHKIVLIHNGRSIPDFLERENARIFLTDYSTKLSAHTNELWIGTIGELHPIKQHNVLIRAVQRLVKDGMSVRHIIIGDGELREKLESLVHKLHIEEHVFLLGHINEAAQYLKAFDIFALASKSEALAYVIIEAGYAGLPVVASNVGGIPEIVTNKESGLLVPQGDVTTFASALRTLIRDKALREYYGEALEEKVREQFSIERMIAQTEGVYRRTI